MGRFKDMCEALAGLDAFRPRAKAIPDAGTPADWAPPSAARMAEDIG